MRCRGAILLLLLAAIQYSVAVGVGSAALLLLLASGGIGLVGRKILGAMVMAGEGRRGNREVGGFGYGCVWGTLCVVFQRVVLQ